MFLNIIKKHSDLVDTKDKNGHSVLYYLIQKEFFDLVPFVVYKDDICRRDSSGNTVLHTSMLNSDSIAVEYLIKEFPELINSTNHSKQTPLHFACEKNQLQFVKLLIEVGKADVEALDHKRQTPIFYTTDVEVVQYLVNERKANLKARNIDGQTVLDYTEDSSIREYLKQITSDPKPKNSDKETDKDKKLSQRKVLDFSDSSD